MLKFGYITELDTTKGLVRVHFDDDDIVSNPLPVSVTASKSDKYSFPFAINEHVWCMMDNNCEFGVVGGAIYSAKDKPPSDASPNTIDVVLGATKLQLKIDRQAGNLTLKVEGNIIIQAKGNVGIDAVGNTSVKCDSIAIEATGAASVKGLSLNIEAPTTTVSGVLNVEGAVTASSIAAGGFSGLNGGAMVASSDITTTADIKAGTVSLKLHKHTSASSGSPTSPPI